MSKFDRYYFKPGFLIFRKEILAGLSAKKLSAAEARILALVDGFSCNAQPCYANNQWFADQCGITYNNACRIIRSLIKRGKLIESMRESSRQLETKWHFEDKPNGDTPQDRD